MRNARLDEAQAEIKIAGRNINNLRYITLMAEIEEELKGLMMRVKEESECSKYLYHSTGSGLYSAGAPEVMRKTVSFLNPAAPQLH